MSYESESALRNKNYITVNCHKIFPGISNELPTYKWIYELFGLPHLSGCWGPDNRGSTVFVVNNQVNS